MDKVVLLIATVLLFSVDLSGLGYIFGKKHAWLLFLTYNKEASFVKSKG